MCELFALSSKLPTIATFSLEEFSRYGGITGPHRDGWGLAFYEDGHTQILREIDGRRHVFCHNGDLINIFDTIELAHFKPVGDTDSEYAFCFLMAQMEALLSPIAQAAV